MRVCPACGRESSPDDRFCPACGRPSGEAPEGGERKLVTVLFADVTGFTGLGEALDPEVLSDVMGSYYDAMRSEVVGSGGMIEKFIGDAVVAVFGVPQAGEDDATRALHCALGMRSRLDALNRSWSTRLGIVLQMRIGINTGEALTRTGGRLEEGIVTGDVVNVASRLEQMADPGRIMVADRTVRAARSAFEFATMGPRSVKGRVEPVHVHELLAVADTLDDGKAPALSPFVDRQDAIAELLELTNEAFVRGRPSLVILTGEAGSGKSRLAEELARSLRQGPTPPRVVRGRCRPPTEASAYSPLGGMLKLAAGVLDTDTATEAVGRVRAMVSGDGLQTDEELARVVAALAWSVGLEDARGEMRDLPPRQVRYETHLAWRTWLSAVVAAGPCLLVLEDIHWADPALLDLLEELAERVVGPLAIVCTARPELTERAPGWGRGPRSMHELALGALPIEAASELVKMCGGESLSQEDRRRIAVRAEGNPFFLEELVLDIGEPGAGPPDERLPDTVLAVLAARIDRLAVVDKRTLQLAAVAGRTFWPSLVATLAGVDVPAIEAALGRLVERSFLVRTTWERGELERFAFKHALTQQVAYESLSRRSRARVHALVARWIEGADGDRRAETLETLAHHDEVAHRLAAGDPTADQMALEGLRKRAFLELLAASHDARSRFTLDAANSLAQRALTLARDEAERSDALASLGEAYLFAFWGDRAWSTLREAAIARSYGAPDDGPGISRLCAQALETPMRWGGMTELPTEAEARELLDLGLGSVGAADSEERARMLYLSSMWPRLFGDDLTTEDEFRKARQTGEEAAAMARRLGLADLESAALDCVGTFWYARGLYAEMTDLTARRLALVPRLHDLREIEDVHAMAAWVSFHRGRYREAFQLANEGVRRTADLAPTIALHSLEWRTLARYRLGDWNGVMEDLALARSFAPRREDESRAGFSRRPWAVAALIEESRGDPDAADRLRDEMSPLVGTVGERSPDVAAVALDEPISDAPWTAWFLALRGRIAEASQAVSIPAVPWFRDSAGLCLEVRCEVVALTGSWAEASEVAAKARHEAEVGGSLVLPAFADRLEARAAMAAGEDGPAVHLLERAVAVFESAEAPWELAVTLLDLAEALAAEGHVTAADAALARARPSLEALGSRQHQERFRSLTERLR